VHLCTDDAELLFGTAERSSGRLPRLSEGSDGPRWVKRPDAGRVALRRGKVLKCTVSTGE